MPRKRILLRTIGDRIKERREALGYTQKKLAEKVSSYRGIDDTENDNRYISIETVRNWEQGFSYPNHSIMLNVAKVLKCDISYLYGQYDKDEETVSKALDLASDYSGLSKESISNIALNLDGDQKYVLSQILEHNLLSKFLQDAVYFISSQPDLNTKFDALFGLEYIYDEDVERERKQVLTNYYKIESQTHYGDVLQSIHDSFSEPANILHFYSSVERLFFTLDVKDPGDRREELIYVVSNGLQALKSYNVESCIFKYSADYIVDNMKAVEKEVFTEEQEARINNKWSECPLSFINNDYHPVY